MAGPIQPFGLRVPSWVMRKPKAGHWSGPAYLYIHHGTLINDPVVCNGIAVMVRITPTPA